MKRLVLLTDLPYGGKMRSKGETVEVDDETARRWLRDANAAPPEAPASDRPKVGK